MRLTSITDWHRPSTWLLLTIVSANLLAPLLHFWSANAATPEARARAVPVLEPRVTAARVEPVITPLPAKRVAPVRPVPAGAALGSAERSSAIRADLGCRAWGPFEETAEAETLALRLQLKPDAFRVFEAKLPSDPEHLVTLRVPGGRASADRVIAELIRLGVDSYLLERSRQGSVLALGVFSTEQRAEAQRQRVLELGYETGVRALDRSRRIYHLLARVPENHPLEVAPSGACGDIAPMHQFL